MLRLLDTLDRVAKAAHEVADAAAAGGDSDAETDAGNILTAADALVRNVRELEEDETLTNDLPRARHKLRTPINQILGYTELMLEECEDTPAPWQPTLEAIHVDARNLVRLVDVILEDASPGPADTHPRGELSRVTAENPITHTLLIVDDNATNRDMLTRRLHRVGLETVEAQDGKEALEVARRERVDLVLMDIMMPVMDGFEALVAFKADAKLRHIPVIMLTSLDEPETVSKCIENGAEDHLPKPFDPVLLRARIGACLEKKDLHDREVRYRDRVLKEKRRADDLLNVVIPLGVALSAENEYDRLLERTVRETRNFCRADLGALFLKRRDALEIVYVECESLELKARGPEGGDSVPLDEGSQDPLVRATRRGTHAHVPDLRGEGVPKFPRVEAFDSRFSYETRSMLAVPLKNPNGEVIGALQLCNAFEGNSKTSGFDAGLVQLVLSMSALSGAALESYSRLQALRNHISALEIQIDETRKRQQVAEITETDYFRGLREKAKALRKRSS